MEHNNAITLFAMLDGPLIDAGRSIQYDRTVVCHLSRHTRTRLHPIIVPGNFVYDPKDSGVCVRVYFELGEGRQGRFCATVCLFPRE